MKNKYMIAVLSFCFMFLSVAAYCQTPFEKGMTEFKDENYEEALTYFLEARKLEPQSSRAAFYAGLTHKLMEEHKEAIPHLRDAATFSPSVKEAVVELIDSLYQTNELVEARKWIQVGEKEQIEPPRLQFLKGLVLVKEERYGEAIQAFEKAKALDPKLGQAAEFQIANAYMRQGNLRDAHGRFKAVNRIEPNSDLGIYARDYENLIGEKLERERPWRFSLGFAYKYDSNVVARGSGPIADTISGASDSALNFSLRAGYTAPFSFRTPYSLSFQYSLFAERFFTRGYTRADNTQGDLSEFNNMTNTLTMTPGYNFDRYSLTLPLSFGYTSLQGAKGNDFLNELNWFNQTRYMQYMSANPTLRILVNPSNMAEVSFGLMKKTYFSTPLHPAPINPSEDRDSTMASGSLGWTYFFKQGKGLVNLRYTYGEEQADGDNWTNKENRFGLSFICPIAGKLRGQVTGDAAFVDYVHTNNVFNEKRRDEIYSGTAALMYEIFKNTDLIAQYAYIRNKSNIDLYDYEREVLMLGIEYRY